jgi:hypothetical protein
MFDNIDLELSYARDFCDFFGDHTISAMANVPGHPTQTWNPFLPAKC